MYNRILVAIDASPDSPDDSLDRTTQFAKMAGGSVHLLHVARGHIIPSDISAGAGLGVRSPEDDVDLRERQVVQDAVDLLGAAGIDVHGEMIEATEHDVAEASFSGRRSSTSTSSCSGTSTTAGGGGRAGDPQAAALFDPAGQTTGLTAAMNMHVRIDTAPVPWSSSVGDSPPWRLCSERGGYPSRSWPGGSTTGSRR